KISLSTFLGRVTTLRHPVCIQLHQRVPEQGLLDVGPWKYVLLVEHTIHARPGGEIHEQELLLGFRLRQPYLEIALPHHLIVLPRWGRGASTLVLGPPQELREPGHVVD